MSTIKWSGAPTARGSADSVASAADGSYTVGTAIDNTTNLDQYGAVDIILASYTPTTGGYIQLFLVQSIDGTTYEDVPSATNPGYHTAVATVSVNVAAAAHRVMSPWFRIPPGKFKMVLLNKSGAAFAAGTNTFQTYTSNDAVV